LILRKFEDSNEQNGDALLGSLNVGIRNKWLIGKGRQNSDDGLNFALKYSVIEPGKLYPMHANEHAEAIFVMDGTGLIKNEKQEFEIKAGDIVLTRGGEMCSIRNLGKNELKTLSCIDLVSHQRG
jgi:mannose-6-phosphate isomerase-like protein (cupin superfamily)